MRLMHIQHLRWLLIALFSTILLHVHHLAIWVSILIMGFGVWRYWIAKQQLAMPKLIILLPLTMLAALGILFTYKGFFGRDASVALLSLMLALKIMESNTQRDFILLILAGYFLSITGFLFTQSMLLAGYMLVPITLLSATLLSISYPQGELPWQFQLKYVLKLLAQSVPFMLVLFVLFPRIPGPLWGIPQDSYNAMSGLGDSMQPGNISDLTLSAKVAFRAEFKDNIPPQSQLYWRGPVLWHYDGTSWVMRSQNPSVVPETVTNKSDLVRYSITLEPHNRKWLLLLDTPQERPADAIITSDKQVLAKEPVRIRTRYDVSSHLSYTLAETLTPRDRELALQLNDDANPKSFALAKQWSTLAPEQIVANALNLFKNEAFIYTLSPPLLGDDPMDDFLFNTRKGFCEHYASSFVFLMRAAGVPARVVTGYQGGELNPIGQYLIVRQSDAHAWAEVWLQGRGWVRIDPTAAVSPSRIESGMENVMPEALPLMSRKEYPLLKNLYLNWDALNNGWNQYVLGYNNQRQLDLMQKITGSQTGLSTLVWLMVACMGLLMAAVSYLLFKQPRLKIEPAQKAYLAFLKTLHQVGLNKQAHEGALDFGVRAAQLLPHKQAEIATITDLYIQLRYQQSQANHMQTLLQLQQAVSHFKLT